MECGRLERERESLSLSQGEGGRAEYIERSLDFVFGRAVMIRIKCLWTLTLSQVGLHIFDMWRKKQSDAGAHYSHRERVGGRFKSDVHDKQTNGKRL